nr:beta-ketoacyl synthase N-terminal-like domain-containing protein [Paenibacillus sp. CGMCC 1.18879]
MSSKGRCESFGEGGDGYVPGEGVGAVLLKPLSKAIADGDQIYGVIKGTAINHGGKTNGYTVPSPNAQGSLIGQALKEAGVNPRTISYLEAHGTGTVLGDPIEITGLTRAFGKDTADRQFCAIGSVKSNIGHCEGAAGIAGLTKVLLQFKNGQIAPSLHSKVLNPNIDFKETPFVVQQELTEWKRPQIETNGEVKEYPRRAGVSSFGAGGANAHVIIEEYISEERESSEYAVSPDHPVLIVLSAKNEERLEEQVRQLLGAIQEQAFTEKEVIDIAYTLQVGREAMEERLAVIVSSLKELQDKLTGFLEGKDDIEDLYRGQVKRNKETMALFTTDEDLSKATDAWISKRKYGKLLDVWVKGLNVDWNRLYPGVKPHRISLPTYPFAKERYWLFGDDSESSQRKMCFLKKQWEQCSSTPARKADPTIAILSTQETMGLANHIISHFPRSRILDINDLGPELRQSPSKRKMYDGLIDLTGCGTDKNDSLTWVPFLQQLIEQGDKDGLTMLCVTKGLESCHHSTINLSGASHAGLYRMLQSEYNQMRSRHMDLEPSVEDSESAQQIASEYLMDSEEPEVCYMKGKRYRSYLQEYQEVNNEEQKPVFPEEHVLLITGGTRGLGYLCAQHFIAEYGVKRIVLTGREQLPPREEWDLLKQQHPNTLSQKIRAIENLEAQGVQVQVRSVQLTDPFAVQECIREIKNRMGPIGGVIHCAGMNDRENPAFIRKPLHSIQQVLEPKVAGLQILNESVKDEPLQFFILFSSVSGIVPTLATGQSDYAMANAYMDYFAESNAHSLPIISIQWPNWKETGMGEVKGRTYEQTGLLSHTNREGLSLLDKVLARKIGPVILPAVVNPDIWKPDQLLSRAIQQTSGTNNEAQRGIHVPSAKTASAVADSTEKYLLELFARELMIDPAKLDVQVPFQDYGVNSVLLAQILQEINKWVSDSLDPSIFYEYSTIESLARWMSNRHQATLSDVLGIHSMEEHRDSTRDVPNVADPLDHSEQPAEPQFPKSSDIAVIGLSCRFPGATNLEKYWRLLAEGRTAIGSVPKERWGYPTSYYAGLVDNIAHFDPEFFLISKEDIGSMDPQALLVLEECLHLWYHAGYTHQEVKGEPIGVYLGARSQFQPDQSHLSNTRNPIMAVGQNYLAANISQFFDLRGPSLVLDTACSSALVGMKMAAQALHSGEITSAVVGGVSLLNTDSAHRLFQQRNILSPDPSFHIFDQRSQGIVLGEGVGMVLLKTVEQALADGDRIYATIKAIAVNNDGRTAGPATPNLQAQKEVMKNALAQSGKKAEEVSYIEANGSGSEVTDLLELKAIQSVYRPSNSAICGLGSIKPNIGHPLCAEGIASFIKVVLMLENKQIVPFLSGEKAMTHYDMKSAPFLFYRNLTDWTNMPRVAAINCFADGGTNAHVILESWEESNSYIVKRHPLPPPELKRYDVREEKTAVLATTTVAQDPLSIRNHQKTSNTVSIWKRNIVEES